MHLKSIACTTFVLACIVGGNTFSQTVNSKTSATKNTSSQVAKPHAELKVTVENGVAVSQLKTLNAGSPKESVTIEIEGFQSNKGTCAIMFVSDKLKYYEIDPRKPRTKWIECTATATDSPISGKKSKFIIHNVPHGEYVVAAFHDKNGNKLLDANFVGLPKEAYGFSRGVRWGIKIPKWETANIKVDRKNKTFTIKVR